MRPVHLGTRPALRSQVTPGIGPGIGSGAGAEKGPIPPRAGGVAETVPSSPATSAVSHSMAPTAPKAASEAREAPEAPEAPEAAAPRKLFKGRLKPPVRDPLALATAQPAILQHEMLVEQPGAAPRRGSSPRLSLSSRCLSTNADCPAPPVEVCSTQRPQPFLNPDEQRIQQG